MPGMAPEKTGYEFNAEYDAEFDAEVSAERPAANKPAPPSPVAPASPPVEAAAPQHSALSVAFAKDFGFTDEEIASLSPKELDTAVRLAHKSITANHQQMQRTETLQGGNKPPEAAPAPAKPEPTAEEDDPFKELEEEFDPKLLKALRASRAKDKDTIDGLRRSLGDFEGRERARAMEQVYDQIDGAFAKMPADVVKLIGPGTRKDITAGSMQHVLRKAILEAAEADTSNAPFTEKMNKAARVLVPASAATAAEPELAAEYSPPAAPAKAPPARGEKGQFAAKTQAEREEAWEKAGTAPPTNRENPLPKGETRALKTAREFMLKAGMLDESDMPEGSFPA